MKTGTLSAVSNKATWRDTVELTDAETGDPIDLETDVSEITLTLRDIDTEDEPLAATLTGGEIVVVDDGIFEFVFTVSQMDDLDPKTYEIGVLITTDDDGDTEQIILGTVSVVKGL